jgi:hypothetical protein
VDVLEEEASAAEGCAGPPRAFGDSFREDVDLGRASAAVFFDGAGAAPPLIALLEVAAGAAVEADKADEVAVEVAEREAGGVADVAALDLDAADALFVDVAGEDVVAGEVGVGLPGRDAFSEQ